MSSPRRQCDYDEDLRFLSCPFSQKNNVNASDDMVMFQQRILRESDDDKMAWLTSTTLRYTLDVFAEAAVATLALRRLPVLTLSATDLLFAALSSKSSIIGLMVVCLGEGLRRDGSAHAPSA